MNDKNKDVRTEPGGIDVATPEPQKTGKPKKEPRPPARAKHLISLSEYKTVSKHDITPVLEHGFRVWMQTEKKQPLSSRVKSEWDNLFVEYLKS